MIERSCKLEYEYYFKGDYVRTPDGVGIVAVDEEKLSSIDDLKQSVIIVQHKFGLSSNPQNEPKEISRGCLNIITEREYNDESEYSNEKIIEKKIFPVIVENDSIAAVKCCVCGVLHEIEADTFVSIHGNITIGIHGGVVGDNFDEFGNLKRCTYICKHPACFNELMGDVWGKI
jgi:hypothetical protein